MTVTGHIVVTRLTDEILHKLRDVKLCAKFINKFWIHQSVRKWRSNLRSCTVVKLRNDKFTYVSLQALHTKLRGGIRTWVELEETQQKEQLTQAPLGTFLHRLVRDYIKNIG